MIESSGFDFDATWCFIRIVGRMNNASFTFWIHDSNIEKAKARQNIYHVDPRIKQAGHHRS